MYNDGQNRNRFNNDRAYESSSPKFIVNHLDDVHICTNYKMASDLANFGLSVELGPEERHLYAFFKQLQRNAQFARRKHEGPRITNGSTVSENFDDSDYVDDETTA